MLAMIKLEINRDVLKQSYINILIINDSISKQKFIEVIADFDDFLLVRVKEEIHNI